MLSSIQKTLWMQISAVWSKSNRLNLNPFFCKERTSTGKMNAHEAYNPYRRSLY